MSVDAARNTLKTGYFERGKAEFCINSQGQYVLRREAPAGVVYHPPALPEGFLRWTPVVNRKGTYELVFTKGRKPDAHSMVSLWTYCQELRKKRSEWRNIRCGTKKLPPPLAKLDAVADAILRIAANVHQSQRSLGLVTPENIWIVNYSRDDSCQDFDVFLADLGFFWDDHPILPPNLGMWNAFWDDTNLLARLTEGQDADCTPTDDVRLLGQIFASCLLGKAVASIPSPTEVPETSAQRKHIKGARRIWITLDAAVSGHIATSAEFRHRLAETPLSQQFLANAQDSSRVLIVLCILFLAIMASAVYAALQLSRGNPISLPSQTNPPYSASSLPVDECAKLLSEVQQLLNEYYSQPNSYFEKQRKAKLLKDRLERLENSPQQQKEQDKCIEHIRQLLKELVAVKRYPRVA